jgi:hypothetical protein
MPLPDRHACSVFARQGVRALAAARMPRRDGTVCTGQAGAVPILSIA